MIKLRDYQTEVLGKLKSGSILCGGVGSGKSLTSLKFYLDNYSNRELVIITTAKKRDSLEWDDECSKFALFQNSPSYKNVKVVIDSWNNIKKYVKKTGAFFIFDEQRLVGSGVWVKSFLNITKRANKWILLTATPGDSWVDYIPLFVAHRFYNNRTEFLTRHAVYNRFSKYPKIDRFLEEPRLKELRDSITVNMEYRSKAIQQHMNIQCGYDTGTYKRVAADRWNIYKNKPIRKLAEFFYTLRKITNSSQDRINNLIKTIQFHNKVIIFYSFDYELDILRRVCCSRNLAEWNGHKHEEIPKTKEWVYLVQYSSGAEGWNCIETDTIVFYSQTYSYKQLTQACGRIDRMNSPFGVLKFYHLISSSPIDKSIKKALEQKRNFNGSKIASKLGWK